MICFLAFFLSSLIDNLTATGPTSHRSRLTKQRHFEIQAVTVANSEATIVCVKILQRVIPHRALATVTGCQMELFSHPCQWLEDNSI